MLGLNSRLDELQAALLRVKLSYLDNMLTKRKELANWYLNRLPSSFPNFVLPYVPENVEPCWHLFVVKTTKRENVQQELKSLGIDTIIHYPIPPHRQQAYHYLGWQKGAFPLAESLADEVLSLPLNPQLQLNSLEGSIFANPNAENRCRGLS